MPGPNAHHPPGDPVLSRKTKRNQPPAAAPQAKATGGLTERKLLFGFGLLLLVLVVAGILVYRSEQAPGPQVDASAALASTHSPSLGAASAKVHVVEFLDPACETCAAFYPIVKQLMAENPGRIRLSIRHVALHEGSELPVRVLEASRAQDKYWETLEALFATQSQWAVNHTVQPARVMQSITGVGLDMAQLEADMNSAEVTQRIERDLSDAKALRVTATPEYFVNGKPMPSFGEQQLRDLVSEALQEAY
jgi:protein-disulfide isomerase